MGTSFHCAVVSHVVWFTVTSTRPTNIKPQWIENKQFSSAEVSFSMIHLGVSGIWGDIVTMFATGKVTNER